tara:strand:- start:251 stop:697 length:447 start_codon:yes stop_codon:yes gene_type:complete
MDFYASIGIQYKLSDFYENVSKNNVMFIIDLLFDNNSIIVDEKENYNDIFHKHLKECGLYDNDDDLDLIIEKVKLCLSNELWKDRQITNPVQTLCHITRHYKNTSRINGNTEFVDLSEFGEIIDGCDRFLELYAELNGKLVWMTHIEI